MQEIDFLEDVPSPEVPFAMVLGSNDARGRAVLAHEWVDMVDAPFKERSRGPATEPTSTGRRPSAK